MAIRELLKSGGMIAGLALLAMPDASLAKGHNDYGGGHQQGGGGRHGGGNNGGGDNGGGGRAAWRAQQQQIPAQGQQVQVQVPNVQYRQQQMPRQVDAPAQVQWRGNRDAGGDAQNFRPRHQQRQWSGNGGGGGDSGNQPRRMRQPRADTQVQVAPDAGRWQGQVQGQIQGDDGPRRLTRNRSYADPDRNRTYRDGNRDWNRDNGRDGNRRDWGRDDHQGWNNNWRQDNRYNWHGHRNRYGNRYRLGSYYAPYRGYSYNRLSAGFFMDSLFFSSRYWIDDPWQYRLPDAYGPYRWVRYYDDVLLVDIYTGEVVDVIHDFFW